MINFLKLRDNVRNSCFQSYKTEGFRVLCCENLRLCESARRARAISTGAPHSTALCGTHTPLFVELVVMAEKGVMLADRPAMRAPPASSYGGYSSNAPQLTAYGAGVESSASLSAAASVGNYKGVMLCNRPDPSGGMGNTASGGSTPFSVPGHHEQVHPRGQNPGLLERLSKLPPGRMSAAASSVEKTKEFLRELAAKKEELLRQKAEEEAKIEEKRQRLAEQSRLLRELIRNNVDENATLDQHADGGARPPLAEIRQAGNSAYSHADVASRTAKQNSKAENKPAWARSAAAVEADEDDEADKLLDFADNLDFGNYEADLEVRHSDDNVHCWHVNRLVQGTDR